MILKKIDEEYLIEMSNVVGKYVKNPEKLPFSFYFSSGVDVPHSIRVKPMFNPEKLKKSLTGTLKLSDDWKYIPGENDKNVSEQEIKEMKKFFKDNIVLFVLVWDEFLQDSVVEHYFLGDLSFQEMLKDLDFYEKLPELKRCKTIKGFEKCIRNNLEILHKLGYNVNFYGN